MYLGEGKKEKYRRMGKSNKVKDWDNEYGGDDDDDFNDDKKPMSKTKKAIISCSISVVFLLVLTFGNYPTLFFP